MIYQIVAAALASDPAEISELARPGLPEDRGESLLFQRISQDPYIGIDLLTFDLVEQKWRWDIKRIEKVRRCQQCRRTVCQ